MEKEIKLVNFVTHSEIFSQPPIESQFKNEIVNYYIFY